MLFFFSSKIAVTRLFSGDSPMLLIQSFGSAILELIDPEPAFENITFKMRSFLFFIDC
nr:MAG TPA: hypothetical protein [Caudoviricetes sp.]